MKYMKHTLTDISFCIAILLCGGCSNENEEISEIGADGSRTPLTIHVTADSFDFADSFTSAGGTNTRAEDSGYTTTFTTGDEIGVFAIKQDGTVSTDCKNQKLTYNAEGEWIGNTIYYYDNATYFAYYPYNASLATNITTLAGIVSNFKPQTDQSTAAQYAKSDLMTAAAISPDGNKNLNFTFKHAMSLLEIKMPMAKFTTDQTTNPYETNFYAKNTSLSISGITGAKLYDMGKGVYRYIVSAGSPAITVNGTFMDDGKTVLYTLKNLSLPAGKYTSRTVDYKMSTVTHHLQKGDFFMKDGTLISMNKATLTVQEQTDCVGIVYAVGLGSGDDSDYSDKLSAVHGYVLALQNTSKTWGNNSKTWGLGGDGTKQNGYKYSQILTEAATSQGISFPAHSYCMNYSPVPEGKTSGWYFPTTGQVRTFVINQNSKAINIQIAKISGAATITGGYASISEVTATQCWGSSVGSSSYSYYSKTGNYQVRPVFTF